MFEDLLEVSKGLSEVLDVIEHAAQREFQESTGVQARQARTVIERVRIARAAVGDQLSQLMREVRALEVKVR